MIQGLRARIRNLRNLNPPTPSVPVSDGFGPTPSLQWSFGTRRTGLIGVKQGMTTMWDAQGKMIPVTVIKVQDNQVISSRFHGACGSYVVQVGGFNQPKLHRVARQQLFHYRRYAIPPKRKLTEFKVSPNACLPCGTRLLPSHFVPGQFIDIQGVSMGKGFQGVMKRWGFKGGPASHGTSLAHRTPGSIGSATTPGKVFKGKKMPGRMGGKTCTVQNLQVLKIDNTHNLLFVRGSVPGRDRTFLRLTDAIRKLHQNKLFPNIDPKDVPFPTRLEKPTEREFLLPQ